MTHSLRYVYNDVDKKLFHIGVVNTSTLSMSLIVQYISTIDEATLTFKSIALAVSMCVLLLTLDSVSDIIKHEISEMKCCVACHDFAWIYEDKFASIVFLRCHELRNIFGTPDFNVTIIATLLLVINSVGHLFYITGCDIYLSAGVGLLMGALFMQRTYKIIGNIEKLIDEYTEHTKKAIEMLGSRWFKDWTTYKMWEFDLEI